METTCIRWLLIVTVAVLAPGCLVQDVKQTVYVEPDGSATWTVLEDHVRSDGEKAPDRQHEEHQYVDAVQTGRHPAALAFAQLDPVSVSTTVVRADRPYATLIEARFARFDDLMTAVASNLDGRTESTFEQRDGVVTWTFTVNPESPAHSENKSLSPLADFFQGGTLVLVNGHFIDAVGFDLSADKRAATVHIIDDMLADDSRTEPFRFTLTWTEAE